MRMTIDLAGEQEALGLCLSLVLKHLHEFGDAPLSLSLKQVQIRGKVKVTPESYIRAGAQEKVQACGLDTNELALEALTQAESLRSLRSQELVRLAAAHLIHSRLQGHCDVTCDEAEALVGLAIGH